MRKYIDRTLCWITLRLCYTVIPFLFMIFCIMFTIWNIIDPPPAQTFIDAVLWISRRCAIFLGIICVYSFFMGISIPHEFITLAWQERVKKQDAAEHISTLIQILLLGIVIAAGRIFARVDDISLELWLYSTIGATITVAVSSILIVNIAAGIGEHIRFSRHSFQSPSDIFA